MSQVFQSRYVNPGEVTSSILFSRMLDYLGNNISTVKCFLYSLWTMNIKKSEMFFNLRQANSADNNLQYLQNFVKIFQFEEAGTSPG